MSFVSERRRFRPKAGLDDELQRLFRKYGREAVIGRAIRLPSEPCRPRGGQLGQRIDDHEALLRAAFLHRQDPSRSVENILREVAKDFRRTSTLEAHVRRLRRRLTEGCTPGKDGTAANPPYADPRLSHLALAARTNNPVIVDRGLLDIITPTFEEQTAEFVGKILQSEKISIINDRMAEVRKLLLEFLLAAEWKAGSTQRQSADLILLIEAASTHESVADFLRSRKSVVSSIFDNEGASERDHLSEARWHLTK